MGPGVKFKTRRGPAVQVDYQIHLQEITPWPPSQSLKSIRSVFIQWENGDRNSGSTPPAVPSLVDGNIEFNKSFRLSVILLRDMSNRSVDVDIFQKNLLEFSLYEPRRDKAAKGQLLGTAILDLADCGTVREATTVAIPVNCTRSFRSTAQPLLYFKIQSVDKSRLTPSLRSTLQREASLERNRGSEGDSLSALMNEEYAEEAEFASCTDDDVVSPSHSSLANSSVANSSGSYGSANGEVVSEFSSEKMVSALSSSTIPRQRRKEALINEKGLHQKNGVNMPHLHSDNPAFASKNIERDGYPEPACIEQQVDDGNENSLESMNLNDIHCNIENREEEVLEEKKHPVADGISNSNSSRSDSTINLHGSKHVKSVRWQINSSRSNVSSGFATSREDKIPLSERSNSSESKFKELEQRVKMLEGELREAAAVEVSLYLVVAEHGSSVNKVHAPSRRLSRLYLQAGKGRRASAARSAVSGLTVVAKACGNDVPRLSFWLSNSVVLRAIIRQAIIEKHIPVSDGPSNGEGKNTEKSLTWKALNSNNDTETSISESMDDLGDPDTFISALEKVENWIFSRIVESIWWQTLTPHMQSSAAKVVDKTVDLGSRKSTRRQSSSNNRESVNLSLELWQKAFKEACERLCPVRAAGHECGCLPVISKLIMEQCVARLDVAMFNAVLRKSSDDIPTDPMSDPISDARVLPIQAGKSSFAAGAQLKNALGNWSRWLCNLFGMDEDDDPLSDENNINDGDDDKRSKLDSSFKSFHLLKSLSDLMMLPKDMLLSSSIREEVCPAFSVQLIKRILDNFVPDEFCPDPIPDAVMDALDSGDVVDAGEGLITNLPCTAPPVVYIPPQASSLVCFIGDIGNKSSALRRSSSVLKKSNTSDDELDELESPLEKIIVSNVQPSPSKVASFLKMEGDIQEKPLRYQLLREVWLNSTWDQ